MGCEGVGDFRVQIGGLLMMAKTGLECDLTWLGLPDRECSHTGVGPRARLLLHAEGLHGSGMHAFSSIQNFLVDDSGNPTKIK